MTIPFNVSERSFWRKSGGIINPRQGENIGPLETHKSAINPHNVSLTQLGIVTLAELNAIISDAILDDKTSPRPTSIVTNQPAIGAIDGVNKVYTTGINFKSGTTEVKLNGLELERAVDYIEVGVNGITLTGEPPPEVGDVLTITMEEII